MLLLAAPAWGYDTYGAYVPPDQPQAAPARTTGTAWVDTSQPGTWSVAGRVGADLPLGSLGQSNNAGGMGAADVRYQVTQSWDLALVGAYGIMPYKPALGPSSPLELGGLALKADLTLFQDGQINGWVGVGLGLMGAQVTGHVVTDPGLYPVEYAPQEQGSLGLALVGALGLGYAIAPGLSAGLEVLFLSVDTMGGTSNNLLAAAPGLFVRWSFMHWIPGKGDAR